MPGYSMEKPVTYKIITLGCPVNQAESAAMEGALQEAGFQPAEETADIYIINSCAVTKVAARKSRKEARQARRENPHALVILVGCYGQVEHEEIKELVPEVDVIIGTTGRSRLPQIIDEYLKTGTRQREVRVQKHFRGEQYEEMGLSRYSRQRPVVKIQEGCDEFCTYCVVVLARGTPRSRDPELVEKEVAQLVAAGHREIILAGTHLGIYGRDLGDISLAQLLKRLSNLEYPFRIRLSSLEPMGVTDELLEVMAESPRICPHLYLPLQSGCNRTLKRMGRRYTIEEFSAIVEKARALMPEVSVISDIIVGFPGETEEDHRESMEAVRRLRLSGLHVFPYSPRPKTPAARYPNQVRPDIKKHRVEEMKALGEELAFQFYQEQMGKELQVLVEKVKQQDGVARGEGFSENYTLVRFLMDRREAAKGSFVPVKAEKAYRWGVEGSIKRVGQ